jgi:hypothetical protein
MRSLCDDIRSDPMEVSRGTDRDGRTYISYSRSTTSILRDLEFFERVEITALEVGINTIKESLRNEPFLL